MTSTPGRPPPGASSSAGPPHLLPETVKVGKKNNARAYNLLGGPSARRPHVTAAGRVAAGAGGIRRRAPTPRLVVSRRPTTSPCVPLERPANVSSQPTARSPRRCPRVYRPAVRVARVHRPSFPVVVCVHRLQSAFPTCRVDVVHRSSGKCHFDIVTGPRLL